MYFCGIPMTRCTTVTPQASLHPGFGRVAIKSIKKTLEEALVASSDMSGSVQRTPAYSPLFFIWKFACKLMGRKRA